jgi:hypothetical protein
MTSTHARTHKRPGDAVPAPSVLFDESGNFLIYPTLLGVKVVNLVTNGVARLLGKVENTERFLKLALYQGVPKKVGGCALLLLFLLFCCWWWGGGCHA